MKRLKVFLTVFLCAAVLICPLSFSANAAENSVVTISSAQNLFEPISRGIQQGDAFNIEISLQSDLKVIDGTITLDFDSSVFRIANCSDDGGIDPHSNLSEEYQLAHNSAITVFTAGESFFDFTESRGLLSYKVEVIDKPSGNLSIIVDFKNLMANRTLVGEGGKEDITEKGDVPLISGSVVKSDGFAVSAAVTPLKGDVNLDGVVNINDATALQIALLQKKNLTDFQRFAAQVYYDDKINIRDVTTIQLFLANLVELM